ncbi:hypothetical protein K474DRAFT_1679635 [Panus rudis PR-1116 ss-1]|nr:hypothetical protein K474DRAFT_1679635 [Panus rudis PR-1116 ss-1]
MSTSLPTRRIQTWLWTETRTLYMRNRDAVHEHRTRLSFELPRTSPKLFINDLGPTVKGCTVEIRGGDLQDAICPDRLLLVTQRRFCRARIAGLVTRSLTVCARSYEQLQVVLHNRNDEEPTKLDYARAKDEAEGEDIQGGRIIELPPEYKGTFTLECSGGNTAQFTPGKAVTDSLGLGRKRHVHQQVT